MTGGTRARLDRGRAAAGGVLDPRTWLSLLRLVHHHSYDHVQPRRKIRAADGVAMGPTVSLRNGERIAIGERTRIGHHCSLWAGNGTGRIIIGADCSFGPYVYMTASNYQLAAGRPVTEQATLEEDIVVGDGCWLGAGVIVLPGVVLGEGCIVGAGSVVTRSLPAGSIAVGAPAKVTRLRS